MKRNFMKHVYADYSKSFSNDQSSFSRTIFPTAYINPHLSYLKSRSNILHSQRWILHQRSATMREISRSRYHLKLNIAIIQMHRVKAARETRRSSTSHFTTRIQRRKCDVQPLNASFPSSRCVDLWQSKDSQWPHPDGRFWNLAWGSQ